MVGYGESLDSLFFKVWSDSSWDAVSGDTVIGGKSYTVLLNDAGNEGFYTASGYSGFGQYGGYAIIFDSALASLPDTLVGGTAYTLQTTFTYQGGSYTLIDQETLLDTASVSTPFGTFTGCRVVQSLTGISGVLQSATTYWLAQGPSDVERQYATTYGSYTVVLAYGIVNGRYWGVKAASRMPGDLLVPRGSTSPSSSTVPTPLQTPPSIQTLAPEILSSVHRFRMLALETAAHPRISTPR